MAPRQGFFGIVDFLKGRNGTKKKTKQGFEGIVNAVAKKQTPGTVKKTPAKAGQGMFGVASALKKKKRRTFPWLALLRLVRFPHF